MGESGSSVVSRSDILKALAQSIDPVRQTFLYRLGIVLVAIGMVALPLIYIALILGLAGATVYHAVWNLEIMTEWEGSIKGRTVMYTFPIMAGLITLFFLLKPFFAKQGKEPIKFKLSREEQPFLFDFVEALCQNVKAPVPQEIWVDTEVNASARLKNGFLSIFDRQLVLTIGLPLAAGLPLKEFAGVLAHEFGHFAQGTGMGATYAIRTVNYWFARVVYVRDAWDERLQQWKEIGGWVTAVLWISQGVVWVTRRILWILMWVGRILSGFLSRQMEFDADRYEIRLAGSDAFVSTSRNLLLLDQACRWAHDDQRELWTERRLCNNFPGLIVSQIPQMSERKGLMEDIEKRLGDRSKNAFDTHPPDGERVDNAIKEGASGVFHIEELASVIFDEFEVLCCQTSIHEYREKMGLNLEDDQWIGVRDMNARSSDKEQKRKASGQFLCGWYPRVRKLFLPSPEVPQLESLPEAYQYCLDMEAVWEDFLNSYEESLTHLQKTHTRLHDVVAHSWVAAARVKLDPEVLSVPKEDQEKEAFDRVTAIWNEAYQALDPLMEQSQNRLHVYLQMGCHPEMSAQNPELPSPERIQQLVAAFSKLESIWDDVRWISRFYYTLRILYTGYQKYQKDERYLAVLGKVSEQIREHAWEICEHLGDHLYPYDHADGEIQIQDLIVPFIPDKGQGSDEDFYQIAGKARKLSHELYDRILGDLCDIALKVKLTVEQSAAAQA
ncbi:MAG: M48 family metalloprotease [Verrucomicrobiota bacterium]